MQASTDVVEEARRIGRYTKVEGEILLLLRRPTTFPQAINEIVKELFPLFSEHEIWKGLFDLLEDGVIRSAYTSGYEIGVELA